MQYRNYLAAAVTLGILAACGGNDNKNGDNPAADGRPVAPAAGTPSSPSNLGSWTLPPKPDNSGDNGSGGGSGGGGKGGGNAGNGSLDADWKKSINKLRINDQEIELLAPNITRGSGGFFKGEDDSYKKIVGNNLHNALYGMVYDKQRGSYHTFFQGPSPQQVATTLPKKGEARYSGLTVHQAEGADMQEGLAEFNVNFTTKDVTGRISVPGKIDPIGLKARINNNTFSGYSDERTFTNGSFYGQNAAEMSGVYEKYSQTQAGEREFRGAFGATKRP
ncbi:transferrin-binding protein-like solute binding protein [Cardiobacterium valvarum]|uniref:Transferrin binding protein-like solute binding protein n=1 Tax=Cardiobacterium valvarum TaxID=194702 RepID=A0A381DYU8_9GAMM|nr:transferrin-binding protein-like solute binding protein [Cardiobacterium valvarum]SUX18593.1 Transferrin binding protein-like solute binding protein [Cardiobacterium valvarum]